MTMTAIRYPVAPVTEPLKGTLLDAVSVENNIGWHDGAGLYESHNCMMFGKQAQFCGTPNDKDFDQGSTYVNGFRFNAYGGVDCPAIGMGEERSSRFEIIKGVFRKGESTAIERALMETRFQAPAGINTGRWEIPEDLTPAAAVTPKVGVALLQEWASSMYVGQPTIHVPRSIGDLLLDGNGAVWDGSMLRTNSGAKVASGAGYAFPNTSPTGADAAAGERWIYVTGEVGLIAGDIIERDEFEVTTNIVRVLVERQYIAAVDCLAVGAIRVTLED